MTFTDADHAKAVELYERYKEAEWWPKCGGALTPCKATTSGWCWAGGSGCYKAIWEPVEAMSAIAWAMVERLGPIIVSPGVSIYTSTGQFVSRVEWQVTVGTDTFGSETRFLALAAAVEGMDAAQ